MPFSLHDIRKSPHSMYAYAQGAVTSVWNMNKRSNYRYSACFVFCGGHFDFNSRALSASARSETKILEIWNSQILGGSDRSPKIIKWSH